MYQKILVPLDGSAVAEQILPYARLFAVATGAGIELLRAVDPDAKPTFWPPEPDPEYLKQISQKYFGSAQPVQCTEQAGKPAAVILARAQADPVTLIAMTTHGLSGIRTWLLGSIAAKVVQSTPNPVLLIRARPSDRVVAAPSLKTVFVPLDGSGLAEAVLPHVMFLSRELALETYLVRVYSPPPRAYPLEEFTETEALARYREELRRECEIYLEGKREELSAGGLERVQATVIQGDPAEEIIGLGRDTPDNLIAMSTHGRSGPGRWMLGSVAERVVQHSQDPVLIIRPH
jgi:nucleotide-binding universal stress UspA family protein